MLLREVRVERPARHSVAPWKRAAKGGDEPVRHESGGPFPFSPAFGLRLYRPQSIAAIVAELQTQGIEACAVLDGTDLVEAQLTDHTTRTSYGQLDRVIRNAARLSTDPAFALRAGLRMRISAYGMYGYAQLSSATYAAARAFAARYRSRRRDLHLLRLVSRQ